MLYPLREWEQVQVQNELGWGVASGRTQVIRLMNAPKSKMRKIEKAQPKWKVKEREPKQKDEDEPEFEAQWQQQA